MTARTRTVLAWALSAAFLASTSPAQGQAAEAPAFAVGANASYCHAAEDSLSIWMNLLEADGGEVPYQVFGEAAFTDPAAGVGVDPVADEDFEVRIALSPALSQAITVSGTVNALAYIGSGAYGGGSATIATSLVADGEVLGAAEAKEHTMTPKNSNVEPGATYDPIEWTFEVAEATVPAGAALEWVISGTVAYGNNVFLACHEARGRSNVHIPVTAVSGAANASSTSDTGSSTNSTASASLTNSTTGLSSTATNSTTGNATGEGSKDSPAPPLALAGLAVVAAAAAVRRRLR